MVHQMDAHPNLRLGAQTCGLHHLIGTGNQSVAGGRKLDSEGQQQSEHKAPLAQAITFVAHANPPFLSSVRPPAEPYCSAFAGVPGFTPECFFACAMSSRTLSLPS
jgi:hypothetical protein